MKQFRKVLVFIIVCISGYCCLKENVVIFEGAYLTLKEHRFQFNENTGKCLEVPLKRTGSLITLSCVLLYDQPECSGRSVKVPSNTPCSIDFSFDICRIVDKVKSISLCENSVKDD